MGNLHVRYTCYSLEWETCMWDTSYSLEGETGMCRYIHYCLEWETCMCRYIHYSLECESTQIKITGDQLWPTNFPSVIIIYIIVNTYLLYIIHWYACYWEKQTICGCIAGREAEQRLLILAFLHLLLFKYGPLILDNVSMSTNDG